jgi:hypothetical protein
MIRRASNSQVQSNCSIHVYTTHGQPLVLFGVFLVLCTDTFVEGLEATPNCTGRYAIDDPIFDWGVYSNIGSNSDCKFNFLQVERYDYFITFWLNDANVEEEFDQSITSTIQMSNLVDDDILYNGRGNKEDTLLFDRY